MLPLGGILSPKNIPKLIEMMLLKDLVLYSGHVN